MDDFVTRSFRTPDGLKLIGDVGGSDEKAAVILLHGGGQTRHSWAGAMRHLVDGGYHAVSYDARGHGESDWSPNGDYSLPVLARDLQAVLATLRGPAALVGASMGGMTSFYAIGASDKKIAEALVMVDIVLRPAPAGVEKIRGFLNAHQEGFASIHEAAAAIAAYNPSRPRPEDVSGLMKNLRLRDDGRLHWHWDPRLITESPSTEPPSFIRELADVSSRVAVPTLLVRGGQSDIVDDEGVAEMRKLVPQTEVFEVPGAGHMVAGDKNDAFNEGVISFLGRRFSPH